ncbi:glycoside hydrolase family 13 protein, partial [Parafannyhessea umbonata]|uniref:glycoside hydrolase family 13 protein n=1 Tax=Parafannyhessea umbonata TaxID=604330 RepID=UPI002A7EEA30
MRARHNTSDSQYRNPFGAVLAGGAVSLCIDVWDEPSAEARLRVWIDDKGEKILDMDRIPLGDQEAAQFGDDVPVRFGVTIEPEEPEVIWYSFQIVAADGAVWRYGAAREHGCGEGAFAFGEPPSFQITVYQNERKEQPDWYKNGIVYQIFPDRFYRGKGWEKSVEAAFKKPHNAGPGMRFVDDWFTYPRYDKTQDGRIANWDFYGGTLNGIREKLPYLEALGITVIYLNPIFEAASNHRYDTANYLKIDPMLGTEADFKALCQDASARGISIILDGVFNHVGADSLYFNKYGNYGSEGAAQPGASAYDTWFTFRNDGSYCSWWGVDDLPDVNEDSPDFRELICGHDGVIRKWLRLGARGWRLDVADELSDDFISEIKAAALAEKPDAVVIGEVWEDATNKFAYNRLRHYFWGHELDGTMNYPLRKVLLDFLTNRVEAAEVCRVTQSLMENYPPEAFAGELNLLGSHDRIRLLTILGNSPEPDSLGDYQRYAFRLDKDHTNLAVSRLWVAALLQMTLPGVPSIYYGDEAGLQGYGDPYNRAAFPWRR